MQVMGEVEKQSNDREATQSLVTTRNHSTKAKKKKKKKRDVKSGCRESDLSWFSLSIFLNKARTVVMQVKSQ